MLLNNVLNVNMCVLLFVGAVAQAVVLSDPVTVQQRDGSSV